MTAAEQRVLDHVNAKGGAFLRGANVRVARNLMTQGLVTLHDYGSLNGPGNPDGQRWWCVPSATPEAR